MEKQRVLGSLLLATLFFLPLSLAGDSTEAEWNLDGRLQRPG